MAKAKKETNPDIRRFIDWYHVTYMNGRGRGKKYFFTGKDGSLIQKLLKTYSYFELVGLAEEFFHSEDPFIKRAGYTIGVFSSQINKLVSGKEMVLSDKGMMTLNAGRAWIDEEVKGDGEGQTSICRDPHRAG